MACLKRRISGGATIAWTLDEVKQAYKKYESECLELRETLKGLYRSMVSIVLILHGKVDM